LEELGLAAAGLAHETKNPLGIIMGLSQQIARSPSVTPENRVMLGHIIDEVDRATARLGSFMTFAQQREVRATVLEARTVVTKVVEVLKPDFDSAGVSLAVDCPSVKVLADEEMLQQILVNLLLNSLSASSAGMTVTVAVERRGEAARITVADQGVGIAPELLPDIFKPYVSGRPDGHGLGLAVVKRFVEEQGWTIEVASQLQRGTTVTISGIRRSRQGEPAP
jgi:signal transduction histidine kinase